jgi:hypothetical protein
MPNAPERVGLDVDRVSGMGSCFWRARRDRHGPASAQVSGALATFNCCCLGTV